jgi:uncharacterized lipoprotein NlpE involved in copper resistance
VEESNIMQRIKLLAKIVTGFIILLSVFLFYTGCNNRVEVPGAVDLAEILQLSAEGGVIDFGMVEAESGTKQLSVTMTNGGTEAVTVSEAVVSDTTNYTITTEALPLTLEPGTETTVTGDFHPKASGTLDATLSVTAEGITDPLEITLTGSGNYPPEIVSGYMVKGGGSLDPQGFYIQNGEKNGEPRYKRTTGDDMYLYWIPYIEQVESVMSRFATQEPNEGWVIDSDTDITAYTNAYLKGPSATPEGNYSPSDDDNAWANVTAETKPYIEGNLWGGQTLTAFYGYSDIDGDSESGTSFQWYRKYVEGDDWLEIEGATGKSYVLQEDEDVDHYIRVKVTPKASTGITTGSAVYSDATETTIESGE